MRVGDIEIVPVYDGEAKIPATQAFALGDVELNGSGSTDEDWSPHREFLDADGNLTFGMGGFLIRGAGDRLALVDAGVGPITVGPFNGGKLVESLAALGHRPEDITDVLFTHLHFDHVGWATQKGSIVFPNATYRCDARDWAHFMGDDHHHGDAGAQKKLGPIADRIEPWEASQTLFSGVDVRAAAGHTPGSTIIVVSQGTERAMLLGDVVHCPVELLDDEWATMGDVDPALAKQTRIALARELEGEDVPVAAAHFDGLVFGRLLGANGKRQWVV